MKQEQGQGCLGSQGTSFSQFFLFADEVIVTAPLRITDMTSGLLGGEDGRVYIYNGKRITVGDMTGKCSSWFSPCPEEKVLYPLSLLHHTGTGWLFAILTRN